MRRGPAFAGCLATQQKSSSISPRVLEKLAAFMDHCLRLFAGLEIRTAAASMAAPTRQNHAL
jgi:hypothetical protein